MSKLEENQIQNMIEGMTPEEIEHAVSFIDSDILRAELSKRDKENRNKLSCIADILSN